MSEALMDVWNIGIIIVCGVLNYGLIRLGLTLSEKV